MKPCNYLRLTIPQRGPSVPMVTELDAFVETKCTYLTYLGALYIFDSATPRTSTTGCLNQVGLFSFERFNTTYSGGGGAKVWKVAIELTW